MRSIGLFLLVSAIAFGQRVGASNSVGFNSNAYARPNTFGSITGFGNVVFPGTGHAPVLNNPIGGGHFGGARVGGTGSPGRRFNGGTSFVYVPYGVPVYPEQAPAPAPVYPQQQMAPQVIINQNFVPETARPVVREYSSDAGGGIRVYEPSQRAQAETAPPPAEENPSYLIAFKDHTIYMALAYWIEDGTLHYVTSQNTHNQVSLDLVDRELSDRLNRERGVDFRLPPRR